jgi:hypothetical protein
MLRKSGVWLSGAVRSVVMRFRIKLGGSLEDGVSYRLVIAYQT